MREPKYPENHFCDNRKKVSDVLEELGYPFKRIGNTVKIVYTEDLSDGRRERKTAVVTDSSTIMLTENGEYFIQGEIRGANIGISISLTHMQVAHIKMAGRTAGMLSGIHRKLITGILIRLLVLEYSADSVIMIERKNTPDFFYVRAGVRASKT